MYSITLTTKENIILRTLKPKDAETLFDVIQKNDTHLRKWLGWIDDDKSVADVEKYIEDSVKRLELQEGIDFSIWENDQIIGGVAVYPLELAHKKTSLMYWLTQEAQGKGIMTSAVKIVIDYLFNELKLNRIEISCAVENTKSSALPKKLGFTFEGISRQGNWLYDHFVDLEVYSLLRGEWKV